MKRSFAKRDAISYYDYHQDVGNHTNDCKALKDFILWLIVDGYLREYIAQR